MPATYDSIATTTVGTATSTIQFSSISSAYTDLRIVIGSLRTSSDVNITCRFNSDSTGNYSRLYMRGIDFTAGQGTDINQSAVALFIGGQAASSTIPTTVLIDIFSYAGSTNKSLLVNTAANNGGTSGSLAAVYSMAALWRSTSAINTITFSAGAQTFSTGTTVSLYGILRA